MQINLFKKVITGTALGLALMLGSGALLSGTAFADDRDDHRRERSDQRDSDRDRDRDHNRDSDRGRDRDWRERARDQRARIARERLERERWERQRAWEWQQRGRRDRYGYSGPYYGRSSGWGGLTSYGRSVAEQRGFTTGLDRGRDDGHDRRTFNPNNSDHYRDGDSGYSSSFGSKEAYRQVYRSSFERGYSQGYRETGRWGRR